MESYVVVTKKDAKLYAQLWQNFQDTELRVQNKSQNWLHRQMGPVYV